MVLQTSLVRKCMSNHWQVHVIICHWMIYNINNISKIFKTIHEVVFLRTKSLTEMKELTQRRELRDWMFFIDISSFWTWKICKKSTTTLPFQIQIHVRDINWCNRLIIRWFVIHSHGFSDLKPRASSTTAASFVPRYLTGYEARVSFHFKWRVVHKNLCLH